MILRFDRNGNAEGVNFVVETCVGSGAWTFVLSTRRTRLSLPGLGLGETRSFRVIASANERRTSPSAVATIFAEGDLYPNRAASLGYSS